MDSLQRGRLGGRSTLNQAIIIKIYWEGKNVVQGLGFGNMCCAWQNRIFQETGGGHLGNGVKEKNTITCTSEKRKRGRICQGGGGYMAGLPYCVKLVVLSEDLSGQKERLSGEVRDT